MAQITSTIAGRQFRLACEDGQEEHLQELAEMAAKQWTAQFNPRVPSVAEFVELYRAAL